MYLLVSIIVLAISTMLFRRAAGSLSIDQLNLISYTFYIMVGSVFLGAVLVVYDIDGQGHMKRIVDEGVRVSGWYGVMYTFIMMPIGMLLAVNYFKVKSMNDLVNEHVNRPLIHVFGAGNQALKNVLYISSILSISLVTYTLVQLRDVPIFNVFRGFDATDLSLDRANARLGSGMISNLIETQIGLLYVLTFAAYCYWKMGKKRLDLAWFVASLTMSILSLGFDLVKARVILYLIGFVFLTVSLRGKMRLRSMLLLFLILSGTAVAMYVFFRGVDYSQLSSAFIVFWDIVSGRVVTGQLVGYYYCLDVFPAVMPHIGFDSTGQIIHTILGLPFSQDYGRLVMEYYDPVGIQQGIAGHMTTFYQGEAWANFGLPGLLIAPLFVGFFLQSIFIYYIRSPKTPILVAYFSYIPSSLTTLSSFMGFYYPYGHIQFIVIILFWVYLSRVFRWFSQVGPEVESDNDRKSVINPSVVRRGLQ